MAEVRNGSPSMRFKERLFDLITRLKVSLISFSISQNMPSKQQLACALLVLYQPYVFLGVGSERKVWLGNDSDDLRPLRVHGLGLFKSNIASQIHISSDYREDNAILLPHKALSQLNHAASVIQLPQLISLN